MTQGKSEVILISSIMQPWTSEMSFPEDISDMASNMSPAEWNY